MMDELLQEMIDPAPQRGDVSRWRRLGATAAIFALAGLGITSLTTNALFTDRETTAGDLLTGTVDLSLGDFTFPVDRVGMAPGETREQVLTVTNSGSLQLRYAAAFLATDTGAGTTIGDPDDPEYGVGDTDTVAGTGDLRQQLTLDVFVLPTGTTTCDKDTPLPAGSRDKGQNENLVPETGEATISDGTNTYIPILGDASTTPFTGNVHLLAPGGAQVLCVRATLALDADNTFQNTTARIDLRLDAEQVINNPSPNDPS